MTLPSSPKISVVIPAFNASSHIEECLQYVEASEFKEFEVLLVDDGSTDDTAAKIASYPARVLKNETNLGAAASRDRGAQEARANLILFIDSDILIPPDLLSRIWKFFEEHSEVSVLQGRYADTPYYPNLLSQYKHFIFSFRGLERGQTYVHYVHTACAAMRKDIFREFQFDERLKRREDIEFGHRLSQNGRLIFADSTLTVGHKKKYDLFSFSVYQFQAARGLVLQHLLANEKSLARELNAKDQPLYKKLWLLRPVLSVLALWGFIGLVRGGGAWVLFFFVGIFIVSFLLEYKFRLYLLQRAPLSISLAACWLYFYDGCLISVGALSGLAQAMVRKVPFGGRE